MNYGLIKNLDLINAYIFILLCLVLQEVTPVTFVVLFDFFFRKYIQNSFHILKLRLRQLLASVGNSQLPWSAGWRICIIVCFLFFCSF